jgi:hypothetical protein
MPNTRVSACGRRLINAKLVTTFHLNNRALAVFFCTMYITCKIAQCDCVTSEIRISRDKMAISPEREVFFYEFAIY